MGAAAARLGWAGAAGLKQGWGYRGAVGGALGEDRVCRRGDDLPDQPRGVPPSRRAVPRG
jgi:hypothetical protein